MAWISKTDNKDTTYKEQILARVRNAVIEKPEAMFKDIDKRSETWVPIKEEDGTAITFDRDYFGDHRGLDTLPGPFADINGAERVVW